MNVRPLQQQTKYDFTKVQLSDTSDFIELFKQSLPGGYFQEHGDPPNSFRTTESHSIRMATSWKLHHRVLFSVNLPTSLWVGISQAHLHLEEEEFQVSVPNLPFHCHHHRPG